MTTTPVRPADAPEGGRRTLSGTLGAGAIVFMVVAAAAPLTVIGGGTPIGFLVGNGVGYPALYVVSAVVLLLFSVGLAAMSRYVPRAGAFFTYIGYGLSRAWGLGAAFVALVTYTAVQAAVYGYLGAQLGLAVGSLGGPDLPWWVWSALSIAAVGVLGYRHIELSSRVLGVLLVAEVAIVLAINAAVVVTGGAEGLSLAPFEPANVLSGNVGVGLMFAIAGFIGFESTAVFRDEARDPARTIPRATYVAVIGIGVFYAFSAWALVMAWGPSRLVETAAADPEGMIIATASRYLGGPAGAVVQVLLLTSLFACVLCFHNVIARYQHALGQAGVLPARLGSTHARHGSPHASSLVQTATAVVLLVVFAVVGLDPVVEVFTWMSGAATLGVLVLMALTCLAVLVFFRRTRIDTRPWHSLVAPALGLLGLAGFLAVVIANFPMLVGGSTAIALALEGVFAAALVGGFLVAGALRTRRPAVYADLTDAISA